MNRLKVQTMLQRTGVWKSRRRRKQRSWQLKNLRRRKWKREPKQQKKDCRGTGIGVVSEVGRTFKSVACQGRDSSMKSLRVFDYFT